MGRERRGFCPHRARRLFYDLRNPTEYYSPLPGGVSGHRDAPRAAGSARPAPPVAHFQRSAPPPRARRRGLEPPARLSQDIHIRPTSGELAALRDSIQSGAYRPDAREIATRMLLLGEV